MKKFPFPNVKGFDFLKNGTVKITTVIDTETGETEKRTLHDIAYYLGAIDCGNPWYNSRKLPKAKQKELLKAALLKNAFEGINIIIEQ